MMISNVQLLDRESISIMVYVYGNDVMYRRNANIEKSSNKKTFIVIKVIKKVLILHFCIKKLFKIIWICFWKFAETGMENFFWILQENVFFSDNQFIKINILGLNDYH